MNKKLIIIISITAIIILSVTGFVFYKQSPKPENIKNDISNRIDSESIFIESNVNHTLLNSHLIKTYSEYNELLSSLGVSGHISKTSFNKYDYINYLSTGGPCAGQEYPSAIDVTSKKITIKISREDDTKGACSDRTLHFIPIDKNKITTLPTVEVISAYDRRQLY